MSWKFTLIERFYCKDKRRVYNIELHIARERNKLTTHFKKWEKLVAVIRCREHSVENNLVISRWSSSLLGNNYLLCI